MSYIPTEWKNGDIISAEKMNKIQGAIESLSESEGGGGGVEFYDVTRTPYATTVHGLTYRDVQQKINDGKLIILRGVDTKEADSVHLYVLVQFLVTGNPKHYEVVGITRNGQIGFTSYNLDDELQLYNGD